MEVNIFLIGVRIIRGSLQNVLRCKGRYLTPNSLETPDFKITCTEYR